MPLAVHRARLALRLGSGDGGRVRNRVGVGEGEMIKPPWLWFGPVWNSLPPLNRQQRRMIAARIRKG